MNKLLVGSLNSIGASITYLNVTNVTSPNLNLFSSSSSLNITNATFTNLLTTNTTVTNLGVTSSIETITTIGTLKATTTTIGSLNVSGFSFLQGTTIGSLNLVESGSTTSITFSNVVGSMASLDAGSRLSWNKIGSVLFLSGALKGTFTPSGVLGTIAVTLPNSYTHSMGTTTVVPGAMYCWYDNSGIANEYIVTNASGSTQINLTMNFQSANIAFPLYIGFSCNINL